MPGGPLYTPVGTSFCPCGQANPLPSKYGHAEDPNVPVNQHRLRLVRNASRSITSSQGLPLALNSRNFCAIQASAATGESCQPLVKVRTPWRWYPRRRINSTHSRATCARQS
ncbi:hypothetical protein LX15_000766 [Streptoalloteichus tenebrarius]|uniref:Uncharacterized protein n=2 Tax=Streptoalloteichus tenebrarius (strain ATCC 17920 / DSM 40477 / JCM 4838 / CBS 697.72 / NBRC 16177 / NCIMB 11028 / NRRL B-12390 / A12253. 1 / ISP 5477) TaxID=1933 RepID=A0ABT1HNJ5_STRSD|nr:hypothetical protein [Streptoalloteichus tenebrarius]BFE98713.1 hypothetical protein GCM10020241_03890 [Streptoalloteichus tenebrarius]